MSEPTTVPTTCCATQEVTPSTESTRENDRFVTPPVDIYETKDGLVVIADLPGVRRDDIRVDVDNRVLTIKTTAPTPQADTTAYREFELTNYFRQFTLGEKIDPDKISAEYRNGVLRLSLAFAAVAQPRIVEVKVA